MINEIHITIQQTVGKKKITKIDGINEEDKHKTLKVLRKKFSCGGSVTKEGSIQLQGDFSSDILKELNGLFNDSKIVIHGRRQ